MTRGEYEQHERDFIECIRTDPMFLVDLVERIERDRARLGLRPPAVRPDASP